jgi:hypothetical protein
VSAAPFETFAEMNFIDPRVCFPFSLIYLKFENSKYNSPAEEETVTVSKRHFNKTWRGRQPNNGQKRHSILLRCGLIVSA